MTPSPALAPEPPERTGLPWVPLAVVWGCGLLSAAVALVRPQQVADLTRLFGAGSADWTAVNVAITLLLVAQLGLAAFQYVITWLVARITQDLVHASNVNAYWRVFRFAAEFFREREVDEINNRILEDAQTVARFRVRVLAETPLLAIQLLAYGGYLFWLSPLLAAVTVPLAFINGYFLFFDARIRRVSLEMRGSWDDLRTRAREMVGAIGELRVHSAFDYGTSLLKAPLDRYRNVSLSLGRLKAMFSALNPVAQLIQDGALYWVGSALCILTLQAKLGPALQTSWPDVIGFMVVAGMFLAPVQQACSTVMTWRLQQAETRRVRELQDQAIAFPPSGDAVEPKPIHPALTWSRVSLVTPDGSAILKEIDLTIAPGRQVALVGPAGCGKSTLLRLAVRDGQATTGTVSLDSRPVEDWPLGTLTRCIGYVAQVPVILNRSLWDNIVLSLRAPIGTHLDDTYPLDLTALAGLPDRASLEDRVIALVSDVGLAPDLLQKALDLPPPRTLPDFALTQLATSFAASADSQTPLREAWTPGERSSFETLRDHLIGGHVNTRQFQAQAVVDQKLVTLLDNSSARSACLLSGLGTIAGDAGRNLSGGQRQKIALARVLLKRPQILLMDEGTSALDEISQRQVFTCLRRELAGRTLISISHRLDPLVEMDEIIVLEHGRVVQQGNYEELSAKPGLFRDLLAARTTAPLDQAPPHVPLPANAPTDHVLARSPYFRGFAASELAEFAALFRPQTAAEGQVLFAPGDPARELLTLVTGEIELFEATPDGPVVIERLQPGRLFGEMGLFGGGLRPIGARAVQACTLGVLDRQTALDWLRGHPDFTLQLLESLAAHLREARTGHTIWHLPS